MGSEITLLTIYDKVAGIDGKIDAHIARVDERLDSGGKQLADHETRVRSLERFKYLLLGGCLLGGSLSGAVATLIVFALSKHP